MKTMNLISIIIWCDGPAFCISEYKGSYFFCVALTEDCIEYLCTKVARLDVEALDKLPHFTDLKLRSYFDKNKESYLITVNEGIPWGEGHVKDLFVVKKLLKRSEIPEDYLPGI